MNPEHYLLVKRGCSETYQDGKGKPIQYRSLRDAEYYLDEAVQRTRMDWEIVTVQDYFDTFHPSKPREDDVQAGLDAGQRRAQQRQESEDHA